MKRSRIINLIFLIVITLMIIPQTRQPIQVFINKGLAQFSPSVVKESNREVLTNYNWQLEDVEGQLLNFNESVQIYESKYKIFSKRT